MLFHPRGNRGLIRVDYYNNNNIELEWKKDFQNYSPALKIPTVPGAVFLHVILLSPAHFCQYHKDTRTFYSYSEN